MKELVLNKENKEKVLKKEEKTAIVYPFSVNNSLQNAAGGGCKCHCNCNCQCEKGM